MPDWLVEWWWLLLLTVVAVVGVTVRAVPSLRRRTDAYLARRIVTPRWVLGVQLVRDAILVGIAVIVAVSWWQAATRDEEADRNARIQSCAAEYAATESAWGREADLYDRRADVLFARLVRASATDDGPLSPALVDAYERATTRAEAAAIKADEMAARRIGLADFSAASVEAGGNAFRCPSLPGRLMVEPIEP